MEPGDGKKCDVKNKRGVQLDKQNDRAKVGEEKENCVDLANIVKLLQEKCCLNDEIISRSPMRNNDCHHDTTKPYDYPHNVSRVYGGVTRVVETERNNSALYRRLYSTFRSPNVTLENQVGDVDLRDINLWLNLCKRDPKLLSDFVEDCQNELSKKEISNFYEYRSSTNACSNVSSQLTSPAQSPSERSLTSPESVTYEENSLYYSRSPNIPSLDTINIKPDEEYEEKRRSMNVDGKLEPYPVHYSSSANDANLLTEEAVDNSKENGSTESFPNIGTVMLNLAEDPYESTIDLNQFATVCDTQAEVSSPSFTNEPNMTERDALNERLDPKAKENAWARISQLNIDLLGKGDKEGDTQLMILLVSEKLTLEYVYVIVERFLKDHPEYLSCRNELNQDALYLAAFKLVWEPLIASYLAEALVRGKQDVNKKYDGGNTLLHCLAKQGDTHVEVLRRLVRLKQPNRSPIFDINKKNNKGYTPLHVACETHKKEVVHTYQTIKVLIENGADCTAKDYKDENTPLHTLINESCDLDLVRIFLENEYKFRNQDRASSTVVANRQGNTALHLSCGRNTLGLHHQKEVIRMLLKFGAMIQLKNINGCVPSVLVDSARKQEIKTILHSNRQKQS